MTGTTYRMFAKSIKLWYQILCLLHFLLQSSEVKWKKRLESIVARLLHTKLLRKQQFLEIEVWKCGHWAVSYTATIQTTKSQNWSDKCPPLPCNVVTKKKGRWSCNTLRWLSFSCLHLESKKYVLHKIGTDSRFLQAPKYGIGSFSGTFHDPIQDEDVSVLIYYPSNRIHSLLPLHLFVSNSSDVWLSVSKTRDKFPLIVFAPGYIFANTFYDFLWQKFVPNGYIMVLVCPRCSLLLSLDDRY